MTLVHESSIRLSVVVFLYLIFFPSLFLSLPKHAHAAYRYEGIAFYAEIAASSENVPVHRFYNTRNNDHFYTISEYEKNLVLTKQSEWGYVYEGIGFYAYPTDISRASPVYRFYHTTNGDHFYTISSEEKDNVILNTGWNYIYEGIAFYAFHDVTESSIPIFRFYYPGSDHFYTGSELEKSLVMNGNLGPNITVGLWNVTRDESKTDPFKVKTSETYKVSDKNGVAIAVFPAGSETRVSYDSDRKLLVRNGTSEMRLDRFVTFSSENDSKDAIFDVSRPNSPFDRYRGKISVRYSDASKNLWLINAIPLEQYIWGIGEITGTGDQEYNKTMTTAFRTYGLWKILYSTKYASEGFVIDATPGNQIYNGYDWEKNYPRIREAAQNTLGSIAKHGDDIALTPYSSWTDGRTRSFLERWGSTTYPWCQSVPDPYGKHPSLSTLQLETQGNHMVGISAHGALSLASNHSWDWQKILKYYLSNISILSAY